MTWSLCLLPWETSSPNRVQPVWRSGGASWFCSATKHNNNNQRHRSLMLYNKISCKEIQNDNHLLKKRKKPVKKEKKVRAHLLCNSCSYLMLVFELLSYGPVVSRLRPR